MKRKLLFLGLPIALSFLAEAARADLIIYIGGTLSAARGTSGFLEVAVANQGSTPVGIGSFSFDISTNDPDFTFTSAQISPPSISPYIYSGNSFVEEAGLPFATKTGQELIASDSPADGAPALINFTPRSLGEVYFSISPSATPGPVTITFSTPGTALVGAIGTPLVFTAPDAEFTILAKPPPTIPEPSYLGLLAALGLFFWTRRQRFHLNR